MKRQALTSVLSFLLVSQLLSSCAGFTTRDRTDDRSGVPTAGSSLTPDANTPAIVEAAGTPETSTSVSNPHAAASGAPKSGADASPAAESPPAPQAAPPAPAHAAAPMTPAQVSRNVLLYGGGGSWPVNNSGRVMEVERPLSGDSPPDVFAVFAHVPSLADASESTLSDFGRLFKPDLKPVSFSLEVFRQRAGALVFDRSFDLGDFYVIESIREVSIHRGSNEPFAVAVVFQTADGSDDQWVIFSNEGVSQFSLQETLSRSPILEDIDGDDYLDIIYRERGVEEGTGYETFLTWYKWNGKGYVEYRTTNIVRNLRDFMSKVVDFLSADRTGEFLRLALPKETLASLHRAGLSDSAIFFRIFRPVPSTPNSPNPPLDDVRTINSVIFPNVLENPFTQNGQNDYSFPLTARIITSDDVSHFFTARINLSRNPFVAPEFSFNVVPPGASDKSPQPSGALP